MSFWQVLALSDGRGVACLPPAQDHKRLEEGDRGPNTGGMGAYAPCPLVSATQMDDLRRLVLQRTVDALRSEGRPYVGA